MSIGLATAGTASDGVVRDDARTRVEFPAETGGPA
jgi:hypothetical protein